MSFRFLGLGVVALGTVLGLAACQQERTERPTQTPTETSTETSTETPVTEPVGTAEPVVSDEEIRDLRAAELKAAVDEAMRE